MVTSELTELTLSRREAFRCFGKGLYTSESYSFSSNRFIKSGRCKNGRYWANPAKMAKRFMAGLENGRRQKRLTISEYFVRSFLVRPFLVRPFTVRTF